MIFDFEAAAQDALYLQYRGDQCGYHAAMAARKIKQGRIAELTEHEAECWVIENCTDATEKRITSF